jgi:hypothetical protein
MLWCEFLYQATSTHVADHHIFRVHPLLFLPSYSSSLLIPPLLSYLNNKHDNAVKPNPQGDLLAVLVVSQSTHGHLVQRSAWPDEREGGGDAEGEGGAPQEHNVRPALEEELLRGARGEEGKDVCHGHLQRKKKKKLVSRLLRHPSPTLRKD